MKYQVPELSKGGPRQRGHFPANCDPLISESWKSSIFSVFPNGVQEISTAYPNIPRKIDRGYWGTLSKRKAARTATWLSAPLLFENCCEKRLLDISLNKPHQDGCHLSTGRLALGAEGGGTGTGDEAGVDGPGHGLHGVAGNLLEVGILPDGHAALGGVDAGALGVAVEHGGQLLTGERSIHVGTVRDAVLHGPLLSGLVPGAAGGGVHTLKAGQDGDDHGAGHGRVGGEGGGAGACEQLPAAGEGHGLGAPIIVGNIIKGLAVVHDLDGISVREGHGHTVFSGEGGLDDLLGAVGLDDDGHSAGGDILHRNFHLGGGAAGQAHGDGGGGLPVGGDRHLRHGQGDGLALLLGGGHGGLGQGGLADHLAVLVYQSDGAGAVLVVHGGLAGAVGVLHHFGLVARRVGGSRGNGAVLLGLNDLLGAVGPLGGLSDGAGGTGHRSCGGAVGVLGGLRLVAGAGGAAASAAGADGDRQGTGVCQRDVVVVRTGKGSASRVAPGDGVGAGGLDRVRQGDLGAVRLGDSKGGGLRGCHALAIYQTCVGQGQQRRVVAHIDRRAGGGNSQRLFGDGELQNNAAHILRIVLRDGDGDGVGPGVGGSLAIRGVVGHGKVAGIALGAGGADVARLRLAVVGAVLGGDAGNGQHLLIRAGEGDDDVVVNVVGRAGHGDGDGVGLILHNAAAAGIGQFAAADGQAGQV